jgi:hypothetical protein
MKLNPKWTQAREDEIAAYIQGMRTSIDVLSPCNTAIQWLICQLADQNIAFKVIQLGAGVKRVTTKANVCPKCNGTGKC